MALSSPIELFQRESVVKTVLTLIASEMALGPSTPIELSMRTSSVKHGSALVPVQKRALYTNGQKMGEMDLR